MKLKDIKNNLKDDMVNSLFDDIMSVNPMLKDIEIVSADLSGEDMIIGSVLMGDEYNVDIDAQMDMFVEQVSSKAKSFGRVLIDRLNVVEGSVLGCDIGSDTYGLNIEQNDDGYIITWKVKVLN